MNEDNQFDEEKGEAPEVCKHCGNAILPGVACVTRGEKCPFIEEKNKKINNSESLYQNGMQYIDTD